MTDGVDLDDEMARRIDQAVARAIDEHRAGDPHLSIDEIRSQLTGSPPPVGVPGRRLDPADLIFGVDPNDPDSMNANRRFGQVWADGEVYQLRQTSGFIAPQLPVEHRTGYGGRMDADGRVEGWEMADGSTVRYGPVERSGQRRFRLAYQYRGSVDGYDPRANRRFSGGREVSTGGWRINTALDRRPGHSGPKTFDGNRSGLHGIGANVAVGEGAATIVWGFELEGEAWMQGSANVAGPIDLHEPGHKLTGPMLAHIHRGELIFRGKRSPNAEPLVYDRTTARSVKEYRLCEVDAPKPGERERFVVASKVDRTGRSGSLFQVWRVTERDMELLFSTTDPYGYGFVDRDGFYPIAQNYLSSEWAFPGSDQVASGTPVWNSDPNHWVYAMEFGVIAVSQSVDVERMGEHLLSFPI